MNCTLIAVMESEGSVSVWLDRLRAGDQAAAQPLWERYFTRLAGLARKKLADFSRRAADEEDIALSAFDSFCRCAAQERFPDLHDRHDLWQVLIVIAERKALNLRRDQRRQKRGGGLVQGESAFLNFSGSVPGIDGFASPDPTPEFVVEMAEECGRLLKRLDDPELRQIAVWKMEGASLEEIAARLGRVPRTVQRRLHLIRRMWEDGDAA